MTVIDEQDYGATSYIPLVDLYTRAEQFSEMTGVPVDELVLSRFVNTPIPMYPSSWPEGLRRWAGVRAEAMTSPLMWLSGELASRFCDPDDGTLESDDAWALRVVFELEQRGVFDPDTGEWEDILWAHGIDITDADDEFRVSQWLAGADDEVLDNVALPELHPSELTADPDWSVIAAGAFIDAAAPLVSVLDCATLRADLEMLAAEGSSETFSAAMCGLCELAAESFADHPAESRWWLSVDAEIRRLDREHGPDAVRGLIPAIFAWLDDAESRFKAAAFDVVAG